MWDNYASAVMKLAVLEWFRLLHTNGKLWDIGVGCYGFFAALMCCKLESKGLAAVLLRLGYM
eukprot:4410506-Amphidinium_carterae.1